MDFPDFESQMTWSVGNISCYESDWMACHRLLALNAINGEELWKLLHGDKCAPKYSHQFAAERFRSMLHTAPFLRKFAQHFHARSLEQCFGKGNAELLLKVEFIRFCPLCLRNGFHSPIFQLASVAKCPLHMCDLRICCGSCGHHIGKPKFDQGDFRVPMACVACAEPFIRGWAIGKTASGPLCGAEVFYSVERDIAALKTWQYYETRSIYGEPWQPVDYQAICDGLKILSDLPDRTFTKPFDERLVKVEEWGRICNFHRPPLNVEKSDIPLNDDLEHLSKVTKSIGRHFRRRLREICKHRYPLTINWERDNRLYAVSPVLRVMHSDCPCCTLINHWCAYSGKIISLRNIARGYGNPVYDNYNHMRRTYFLEANAYAQALISSFTWFAVALVNRLASDNESNFIYWLEHESGKIKTQKQDDNFLLSAHRFSMCIYGYVFERQGKEFMYRYSLKFAINEMRVCFDKKSSREKSFERREFDNRGMNNQWYTQMWDHLHTLRDLRWSFNKFKNSIL